MEVGATVKKAVQDICNAEDREHAAKAIAAFARQYGAKVPNAVRKITDDEDELLAFYGFPAEHWIHLRTTHPIESTFATVRLRTKVTKGPGPERPHLRASSSSPPGPIRNRVADPPQGSRPSEHVG